MHRIISLDGKVMLGTGNCLNAADSYFGLCLCVRGTQYKTTDLLQGRPNSEVGQVIDCREGHSNHSVNLYTITHATFSKQRFLGR